MKALVVLLTILAGVWLVKRSLRRRQDEASAAAAPKRSGSMQQLPMQACEHCGMHVPAHEMIQGKRGAYFCSPAHQQAHEGHGQAR